jgi:nucleolin
VPTKGGVQNDDLQVFISGIPYECSEQELRDFFPPTVSNHITEVKLPKYQDSGRCRGYAHVTFANAEARDGALL